MSDSSQTQANPLGTDKISSLLKQFAIPSILAMLVSSLYNVVDQIFIGQDMGYLGNGATTAAFPFSTIALAIALLIGVGTAAGYSLSLGRKQPDEAEAYFGNAVWMMVVLGIAYAVLAQCFLTPLLTLFGATPVVLPYAATYARITAIGMPFLIVNNAMSNVIRADGSPRYSMTCMLVGAIANTILDPVLIFACRMGLAGAAWATVISQILSCSVAVAYIPRMKRIRLSKNTFRLRLRFCGKIASLGMSNSLNQIAITVVQIVINNSLTHYGALSEYGAEIPLSAFGVVMKVNTLFLSFFIGLNQGSQPIISFNYGAKRFDRVKQTYSLAARTALVIGVVGLAVFQIFPRPILALFGSGEELYYEFGVKAMRIFFFTVFLNGVQLLSANFFSAIGKPLKGVLLSLSRQIFFLIPLLLLLPLFLGIDGILYAAPVSDTVAFAVSLCFILCEFRRMRSSAEQVEA
ncbi:MAG: MATE family efflux transporter [Christensenellaceae bacterium]